jgi:hypothetical protein
MHLHAWMELCRHLELDRRTPSPSQRGGERDIGNKARYYSILGLESRSSRSGGQRKRLGGAESSSASNRSLLERLSALVDAKG